MKLASNGIGKIILQLGSVLRKDHAETIDNTDELALSEIYSQEQLNSYGKLLAGTHILLEKKVSDPLLKRLDDNEKKLLEVRGFLVERIRLGKTITPAAEWLLDNFYLIEEQIVLARKHLPKKYSENLPYLANGHSSGMPRIYDIVFQMISHRDGLVQINHLNSFIAAYQKQTLLTLGELWAVPIMLRLAVIQNIRRISEKIALRITDQNLAEFWTDKMIQTIQDDSDDLIMIIADMARSKPVLSPPFVTYFMRKLQGKGTALALPLNWMAQQLSRKGIGSTELIRKENQDQAANQVSIRNNISTLRSLSATDWRKFVETLSSVEKVLRQDIAGTYPLMDFATRDRYRHVVEMISRSSPFSETEVAQKVLHLSEKQKESGQGSKKKEHVGYYLIDKGLKQTERDTRMRFTFNQKVFRVIKQNTVAFYLWTIALTTFSGAFLACYIAFNLGIYKWEVLLVLGILSVACFSQLFVSLVNWFSTILFKPRLLPRMDFSHDIPAEFRTLVIVPTMLSGKDYIEEQVDALEMRFLANQKTNLHYGLLTDFTDADSETLPEDDALLELAKERIEALNKKYKHAKYDIFFLFHRPRKWNKREQKWMGYERKRGKLSALNALINGHGRDEFSMICGNYQIITEVKYVITLDSDTQLPRDVAWKLIATMAHPLNQAVYSRKKRRIIEGYGILQPRVASSISKADTSFYLHMQGNASGIDPYTLVSSDVYQDLFGEGSFIGKGIYDVEYFEKAVHHVFPENHILSHDLIEGCYARSALVSDVIIYEDSPAQYSSDIKRRHRWIRGDWQISAWILPFITLSNRRWIVNRLSALSRWKIFDNLRRSLSPMSLLLFLLMGWFILPLPWIWTIAVAIIILLPVMTAVSWQLIHKPVDLTFKAHLAEIWKSLKVVLFRFFFNITVLPYEAFKFTDAILRTLWRMIFSHKKLLEWTPYAADSVNTSNDILSAYTTMWKAPLVALGCVGLFVYFNPVVFSFASPILIIWMLAPAIAWQISITVAKETPKLSEEQTLFLHKLARRNWSFFEEFVNEDENWLPPDNFQEEPRTAIAHRTSPTNIGLSLLASLSAYDFGYISGGEMLFRCNKTLESVLKLERFKGHLFNWYDTESLLPLRPRYISTVDSGNFTGHLLTLRQGLIALLYTPILSGSLYYGLRTTAEILRDLLKAKHNVIIERFIELLDYEINTGNHSIHVHYKLLDELILLLNEFKEQHIEDSPDLMNWTEKLSLQLHNIRDDLMQLMPWLDLYPAPEKFTQFTNHQIPSLLTLKEMNELFMHYIDTYEKQDNSCEEKVWLNQMRINLAKGNHVVLERIRQLQIMAEQCELLSDVEYNFLFDKSTNLLRIGYNSDEQRKDKGFYDLLASEARFGVFVAIAQGKLPQESWFALGRLLTDSGGDPILISWSGSMFEYLMPQLVMPIFENTLLYQTSKIIVKRQIEYAAQKKKPWGISESGFNLVDASLNYQYRAFGVPGIGLKRGLEEDIVIAPYACMLALMVSPRKACSNLQLMSEQGFEGRYGFYEAIDYTPTRQPRGKTYSIVYSYMAHHQGMGLLSLAYQLLDKPMQKRFVSDLRFQATLLLLQEQIPKATIFYAHTADLLETHTTADIIPIRRITNVNTPIPEIQLLTNGQYQLMITNSGGGYSRWKGYAINRWREDATLDNLGMFCYIKDTATGNFWSNTYQPALVPTKGYEAIFTQGRAEFHRFDQGIDTKTEIVISPEDNTEIRSIRLKNKTSKVMVLDITSYTEIVLASQASDEAHPAFSNLFVQTKILPERNAIMCTRRPRSVEEKPPWMFHQMDVYNTIIESVSYETDRLQFVGRGRSLVYPHAMDVDSLSGSQGPVLDPVMSIRYRISIKPNQTAKVDLIYGISETEEACENILHKYQDSLLKNRVFELSWTHSQLMLRQINATETDAQLFDRLAMFIVYANHYLRAENSVINSNLRGQSGLWAHSVSGDLPIVLLHLKTPEGIDIAKQMIQAHSYLRMKGLAFDLVIWNDNHGSYRQNMHEQILGLITTEDSQGNGTVFVKSADQFSIEDRILFESVARVIIHDENGTLTDQLNKHIVEPVLPASFKPKGSAPFYNQRTLSLPANLLFNNGFGGFTPDGKEYKIISSNDNPTPAPWVNVLANPDFGSVISETGSAYTWAVNAHEYRLTPWGNDPVSDGGGEAFYLRDQESGNFWSPSLFPARGTTPYITTHGFGYSYFEHTEQAIYSHMSVFVDKALPVKFFILKIKNLSGGARKLVAAGFMEMIIGDLHSKTNPHSFSEYNAENTVLLIRNRYNSVFADRVTFFKVIGDPESYTANRAEFIGRNRNLSNPQAMNRMHLSNTTGAAIDPCAAFQIKIDMFNRNEKEIIFMLGNEKDIDSAMALIQKFSNADAVHQSFKDTEAYWRDILGCIQIQTPNTALNILSNGWIVYQTMASRIFARSGFYQSGGAFGFRDQLQDVIALLPMRPEIARQQILLCASRQFPEGDVQHWWNPPEGRGVRTHFSDDLLWLPYVVSRYIEATGDTGILSVNAGFIECRLLHPDEDSLFDLPQSSNLSVSLYEHCVKAINHSLRFGEHGLPLMGTGDWNDGMDRVGNQGKGESVWLAFFQYDILMHFADIARGFGDFPFADTCHKQATLIQSGIENSSWDGNWYLRAWFDDGTPLGSAKNKECRIDAIVQSWSVLSVAAEENRRKTAMASLDKHLVKRNLKLIQLLDPPFDKGDLNPGYIKGYVPGVRENGGQYTHAAIWALMAFAELGEREKVWELFNMINPINHASTGESIKKYKVEPYVIAADVYASKQHKGKGGWTWYTGSAGWMYQFIIRSLLGMELHAGHVKFKPCFPTAWPSVSIVYHYKSSTYHFTVFQSGDDTDSWWKTKDEQGTGDFIELVDDGREHDVEVHICISK
jgi:cyclic beta-1,2-glucan synthetase